MTAADHSPQSRERQCYQKRAFLDSVAAECHAVKWGQRVYACPVCGFWHLTSKGVTCKAH